MKTLVLKVDGMKCGGCAKKITAGLEDLAQGEVSIDHAQGLVKLALVEGARALEVKKAIEGLGGFKVLSFEQL